MSATENRAGCHGDHDVTREIQEDNVTSKEAGDNYGARYEIIVNLSLKLFILGEISDMVLKSEYCNR
jgi:hypothetical protein